MNTNSTLGPGPLNSSSFVRPRARSFFWACRREPPRRSLHVGSRRVRGGRRGVGVALLALRVACRPSRSAQYFPAVRVGVSRDLIFIIGCSIVLLYTCGRRAAGPARAESTVRRRDARGTREGPEVGPRGDAGPTATRSRPSFRAALVCLVLAFRAGSGRLPFRSQTKTHVQ